MPPKRRREVSAEDIPNKRKRGRPRGSGRGRGNGRGRGRGRGRGHGAGSGSRVPASPPPSPVRDISPSPEPVRSPEQKLRVDDPEQDSLIELMVEFSEREMLNTLRREAKGTTGRSKAPKKLLQAVKAFASAWDEDEGPFRGAKNRIVDYFVGFIKVSTEETLEKIMKPMHDIMEVIYPKPNTLASYYVLLRDAVKTRFADNPDLIKRAQNVLTAGAPAFRLRQTDYNASVLSRLQNQVEISDVEVLKLLNERRYAEDWKDQMIFVGLAVGSRMVEIIKVSDYKPAIVDGKDRPQAIQVIGVAKDSKNKDQKDAEGEQKKRVLIKPIIGGITSNEVITMVSKIRKYLAESKGWDLGDLPDGSGPSNPDGQTMTNRAVTNAVNNAVNEVVKAALAPVLGQGKNTFHFLRAIYAEIAWIESTGTHTLAKNAFYSQILGHAPTSVSVSLSYLRFTVQRQLELDEPTLRAEITNVKADLKGLKEELEKKEILTPQEILTTVEFVGKKGEKFRMTKQPNLHDKDEKARVDRMLETAKQLLDHGLKTSYGNFRKLGFGTEIIRVYKKAVKEAAEMKGQTEKETEKQMVDNV